MSKPASTDYAGRAPRRGVAAVCVRSERLLVIERSSFVRAPGKHCFPGGSIEAGEEEAEAIVREMREELGVEIRPGRRLYRSVTPWKIDLAWWSADFSEALPLIPAPQEVAAVAWLSVTELLALDSLLESNREFLNSWNAGMFEIDGLSRLS
jgi:8-oxo-dGTP pyrophosphatase MutT (NUDIX family)